MIRVTLPWPKPELWPNSRESRFEVAREKKAYRNGCGWIALQDYAARGRPHMGGRLVVSLTFCPPTAGRRDMDNMLAAMKSGLDGISDAIGVDDSLWDFRLFRGDPCKGGAVIVQVEPDVKNVEIRGVIS